MFYQLTIFQTTHQALAIIIYRLLLFISFQSATFSPYDTYADYQIQIMTWMTHVFSSLIQMTVHKRAFSYFYCGKRD